MTSEVQNARMAARVEPTNAGNCDVATQLWRQVDIEELIGQQTAQEEARYAEILRQFFEEAEWDDKDPHW